MYVTKSLWNTDTLVFTQSQGSTGYFDENRNWVEGPSETLTLEGSLQPFQTTSTSQLTLPEGLKSSDARLFYTKDLRPLKVAEESTYDLAAETIIDGLTYYIDKKGDWSRIGVNLRHYAYLLIKRGQNPRTSDT